MYSVNSTVWVIHSFVHPKSSRISHANIISSLSTGAVLMASEFTNVKEARINKNQRKKSTTASEHSTMVPCLLFIFLCDFFNAFQNRCLSKSVLAEASKRIELTRFYFPNSITAVRFVACLWGTLVSRCRCLCSFLLWIRFVDQV